MTRIIYNTRDHSDHLNKFELNLVRFFFCVFKVFRKLLFTLENRWVVPFEYVYIPQLIWAKIDYHLWRCFKFDECHKNVLIIGAFWPRIENGVKPERWNCDNTSGNSGNLRIKYARTKNGYFIYSIITFPDPGHFLEQLI